MRKIFLPLVTLSALFAFDLFAASSYDYQRSDSHAPIGVMRDHVHKKGEVMLSYRFSYMKMQGLRNNAGSVSDQSALTRRMVIPLDMRMKMDMFSVMYGVTDDLTASLMGSVISKEMNHKKRDGSEFKRESDGVGDTKVNLSYQYYDNGNNKFLVNAGLSLPTGDIDQSFSGARLSYPMQIGSGSYEFLPGLSFIALRSGYSYGSQVNASIKLNSNSNGYKLGDSYNITAWIAKNFGQSLSVSTRLDYNKIEAIEGRDTTLNSAMIVTADAAVSDYQYIDGLIGANYILPESMAKDLRLSFEIGSALYQKFDDDMLKRKYKFVFGVQKTF